MKRENIVFDGKDALINKVMLCPILYVARYRLDFEALSTLYTFSDLQYTRFKKRFSH